MRAIRISLNKADIFKVQLKAICRASVYGNLAIMFLMIISKEEVVKAKKLLAVLQAELKIDSIA